MYLPLLTIVPTNIIRFFCDAEKTSGEKIDPAWCIWIYYSSISTKSSTQSCSGAKLKGRKKWNWCGEIAVAAVSQFAASPPLKAGPTSGRSLIIAVCEYVIYCGCENAGGGGGGKIVFYSDK